jgi:HSP20 family molecular chaperone IbpA
MAPAVDVYEDGSGIRLLADLPGVSKDTLRIRVEGDTLLIEGDRETGATGDREPAYAEVRGTHYRRSFSLSRELATDQIEAVLKDGVLRVRIPKVRESAPRRIEVQVG